MMTESCRPSQVVPLRCEFPTGGYIDSLVCCVAAVLMHSIISRSSAVRLEYGSCFRDERRGCRVDGDDTTGDWDDCGDSNDRSAVCFISR